MPPLSIPVSAVSRDDILQAERELETAQVRWDNAGRLRVSPEDIVSGEVCAKRLAEKWQLIEQAQLPLDRLEDFETDSQSARRKLQRLSALLVVQHMRTWFWIYTATLQRILGIGNQQLWTLSLMHGVWGVLAAGLTAIVFGWGPLIFGILAILGYAVITLGSLRPLLRSESEGLKFVRADLEYRTATLRSRRNEARSNLSQLRSLCAEIRRGRDVCRRLEEAHIHLALLRENAFGQTEFDRASGELKKLRRILGNERYDLLAADWRSLRGIPFEEFLVRIFRSLGYQVQTTKTTGDQGVDLIAMRNGQRLAIQAKGYNGSVGNDAVQQAHTGMKFYSCNVCVVITNSRFTKPAEELALGVQCTLIDGDQIVALINGQLL